MLKIICMFDRAANIYGRPAFTPHLGAALRDFGDEINRASQDNPLYKHPDDYDLYMLGEFDEEMGRFDSKEPVLLTRGKDTVRKES